MNKDQDSLFREYQEVSRRIRDYMKAHPTGLKDQYVQELGRRRKELSLQLAENTMDHQEETRRDELKRILETMWHETMRSVRERFK